MELVSHFSPIGENSSRLKKRTTDEVNKESEGSIYFSNSFVENKRKKISEVNPKLESGLFLGDDSGDELGDPLNIDPKSKTDLNSGYEPDNETRYDKLLPRCEYFCRFENTSYFPNDIKCAHVYTRSGKARYTQGQKSKDKKGVKFTPVPFTNANHNKRLDSLSAHTGGFASPYTLPKYARKIESEQHTFSSEVIEQKLYDVLLNYKVGLCTYIADEFKKMLPCVDLGDKSQYKAKIISNSKTPSVDDFNGIDIIVCKYNVNRKNCIKLYKILTNKVYAVDISDNNALVTDLLNIQSKNKKNDLAVLLKKFQPYLISKELYPDVEEQGVYCSNNYPCVLVKFTPKIDNKDVSTAEKITFYKRYNHMLMAYFIAIVDYNAYYTAGIEIEMLGRSSFGHNNPSIAVTDTSFRINIGLIPKKYADIIVKSLVQLYNLFHVLENTEEHVEMDNSLKSRLDAGREIGFERQKLKSTYWESLWVKGSHGKTGRNMIGELLERERDRSELLANFVLTEIINNPETFFTNPSVAEAPLEKMFELIRYDSSGKTAEKDRWRNSYKVSELESSDFKKKDKLKDGIYRTNDNKYFQVIEARMPQMKELKLKLLSHDMSSYEISQQVSHGKCIELFEGYIYPKPCTISVDSKPEFKHQKFFQNFSKSDKKVNDDSEFYAIIKKLCDGLDVDLPVDLKVRDLYKFLEAEHIKFITTKRTREYTKEVPEWGSDSETEEPNFVAAKSIHAKKIIVANGMLAINLAYYAARVAFALAESDLESADPAKYERILASKELLVNYENNYFETEDCLKAAIKPPKVGRGKEEVDVLFFDLNSFNAGFIAQTVSLDQKLKNTKPSVLVLDHTSSTTDKIGEAIRTVFESHEIKLLLLVTSGLKNEQGGADNNPYGKLTILSLIDHNGNKDTSLTNKIYNKITELSSNGMLNKKALLPKSAHAIRQSHKDRGFATKTRQMIPSKNVVI